MMGFGEKAAKTNKRFKVGTQVHKSWSFFKKEKPKDEPEISINNSSEEKETKDAVD